MTSNDIGTSVKNVLYRQLGRASGRIQKHRSIPVDLLENDDSYLVVFDAPGAKTDDIQVRYLEGNVKVRVDRFRPFREVYEMRFPGRGMQLDGEAELPADAIVNPDAGTATLTDTGTLRIEIPKASAIEGAELDEHVEAETETEAETKAEAETETETGANSVETADTTRSSSGELAVD